MKFGAIIFACLMFAVLFGVPIAQTFMQDDIAIVLQELEEADAEEGEDVKLKDLEEKLFHSNMHHSVSFFMDKNIQARIKKFEYFIGAQQPGVETPPPRFS